MLKSIYRVAANDIIARATYKMILTGDTSCLTTPGQFVDVQLDGRFLRRPISVCDKDETSLTLIYKVVGGGTADMAELTVGTSLDLLSALGNGFDTSKSGDKPLLIGGGAGVAPLYWLCRELVREGKNVSVILGFATADEVFYESEFASLGAHVTVTTADGTYGTRGFVTDAMSGSPSFIYSCGPLPMMRAIDRVTDAGGEFSLEARMACGFGACMGCSIMTRSGSKRVCREGPVFEREEIIWTQE